MAKTSKKSSCDTRLRRIEDQQAKIAALVRYWTQEFDRVGTTLIFQIDPETKRMVLGSPVGLSGLNHYGTGSVLRIP